LCSGSSALERAAKYHAISCRQLFFCTFFYLRKESMGKKSDTRDFMTFIGFIAPGLLIYLFIIAYPICYSVFLSLTNYNPNTDASTKFVGLANYIKVMTMNRGVVDPSSNIPEFWYALKNNMIVVAVSVFGQIPIGFILAFILYRKQVKVQLSFNQWCFCRTSFRQSLSVLCGVCFLWSMVLLPNSFSISVEILEGSLT